MSPQDNRQLKVLLGIPAAFVKDRSGMTALQYAIIAALVGIILVPALKGVGGAANENLTGIAQTVGGDNNRPLGSSTGGGSGDGSGSGDKADSGSSGGGNDGAGAANDSAGSADDDAGDGGKKDKKDKKDKKPKK